MPVFVVGQRRLEGELRAGPGNIDLTFHCQRQEDLSKPLHSNTFCGALIRWPSPLQQAFLEPVPERLCSTDASCTLWDFEYIFPCAASQIGGLKPLQIQQF